MIRQVIGGNAASNWNRSHNLLSMAKPGSLQMIGSEGVLPGWYACAQQLMPIASNQELFDEIGFTWGKGTDFDSTNTITIPNLVQNVYQIQTITTVADVAGSLNNTMFFYSTPNKFRSFTSASFIQPSVSGQVTVTMNTTAWLITGNQIYIGTPGTPGPTGGYYNVYSVLNSTQAVLTSTSGGAGPGTPINANSDIVDIYGIGAANVYFWNNIGGAGTNPGDDSSNAIEVDSNTNDTDATIATNLANAFNASSFTNSSAVAVAVGNVVTITANVYGYSTPAVDWTTGNPTGYAFSVTNLGSVADANAIGLPEIQTITPVADVGGSLNNTYNILAPALSFYSSVTASYIQPVSGNQVTVSVNDTSWMYVGQTVYVTLGGVYTVFSITNGTTVVLTWSGSGSIPTSSNVPTPAWVGINGFPLYYVWNNIAAAGTSPGIDGMTGIEVDSNTNDTAATIAANQALAILNTGSGSIFGAQANGNVVTILNQATGPCTGASDGAVPTGFAFSVSQAGTWDYLDSKYFILYQSTGSIGVWMSVAGHNPPPPAVNTTTFFQVSGCPRIPPNADNTYLASTIATALQSGTQGLVTYESSTVASNVVTAIEDEGIPLPPAMAGNSGFTMNETVVGGATEFYLPPGGVFFRSWDQGNGNDPDSGARMGLNGSPVVGDNVGTYQADENLSHEHYFGFFQQRAGGPFGVDLGVNFGTAFLTYPSGGNESRPVNVYALYMIKY